MKRVVLASIYHETHTFLHGLTVVPDFDEVRGEPLVAEDRCGACVAGAVEQGLSLGWTFIPAIAMRAMPGPTVADEVVERFWGELASVLTRDHDGVLLVLHGAMVSRSHADVEGEIMARVRQSTAAPIVAVLDLHANLSARMVQGADALVAYRQNPHSDARDAGHRGAAILDRIIAVGRRPTAVWRQTPILWPPTGTGTDDEPMAALEAAAARIEREMPEVLGVSVLPGFAFADVPDAGLSLYAATLGDPGPVEAALGDLARRAWEVRREGTRIGLLPAQAIAHATAFPAVLAEAADNIGAGAPGDCTGVLRALVELDVPSALMAINDPEAVALLAGVSLGERVPCPIGGKGWSADPGPVERRVEVVSRSNGRFTLEDPQSHLASMQGAEVQMGPCAVVRHRGLDILLTSKRTPPFDLAQFHSQGLHPQEYRIVVAKAAVAHRAAYAPVARQHVMVESAGPCPGDLRSLPYRHIRRPVYPLDEFSAEHDRDPLT